MAVKDLTIAIGLPWYAGPDHETTAHHFVLMSYLGRVQERSHVVAQWVEEEVHALTIEDRLMRLPKLDPTKGTTNAELPRELWGTRINFVLIEEVKCSLPGMARERIADQALNAGADYLFMWDADMVIPTDALFTFLRDAKPILGALAFCGREPVKPVIYGFGKETRDNGDLGIRVDVIEDYVPDALQEVDAVGFGCVFIEMDCFRKIKKPWFNVAGMGEDIFFCLQAVKKGIPVHVDTRVKALHKPTFTKEWHDESFYLKRRPKVETFWQDSDAVPA